jgi:hypothetical protein
MRMVVGNRPGLPGTAKLALKIFHDGRENDRSLAPAAEPLVTAEDRNLEGLWQGAPLPGYGLYVTDWSHREKLPMPTPDGNLIER